MLPTGQSADASQRRLHNLETRAVPLAPDHPLVISRRDFSPLQNQFATAVEQQLRVVEGPTITLVDAQQNLHAVLAGSSRNGIGDRARNHHSLLVQSQMGSPHQDRGFNK